jgi:hypothetical protein
MFRNPLLALIACAPLIACSSKLTNDGGTDAGIDGATDAPIDSPNLCPDAGADPGLAGANAPTGTQLQAGDDLSIRGVTSDGWAVYSDDAALTLHATPLAGGNAVDLGALGPKFWVSLSGSVVFIWSSVTGANVGALSTWSAATGLHSISSSSLGLVASGSSGRILYTDHANATGDTADVYAAATDGTGATKLIASASVAGCFPQLGFVGSYAIATHCDVAPNPNPAATVSSFPMATWARTDLVKGAENYWATTSATDVLVSINGVGIQTVPIAGGSATMIDTTGFLGVLTADGKSALYSTKAHALRRSPIASPSPMTLITDGFGGFWSMSPDEQWVLYFSNLGMYGGDIFMASTLGPGVPVALSKEPTGALRGDSFTKSSSHALYSTNVEQCTGVGTLQAQAVNAASAQPLGQRSWTDWSLPGSKVIFNDNFIASGGLRFGRADIESVDLAKGPAPTRLVDRADAVIGLSPTGDRLVYVWSARPGAVAGLYVAPL